MGDSHERFVPRCRQERRFLRPAALVLAASLAVSGCATSGGQGGAGSGDDYCNPKNPRLTSAERQMCADAATTFNETVAGGAITGALAGAAIGALAGLLTGDSRDVARGALIGAAAGGIAGGVDGYITAKAQEAGNNRTMMLNSMTTDVEQQNEKLRKLVASSRRVLEDSQQRYATVTANQQAGRATAAQVKAERQRIEGNRNRLASWLEKAKEERDTYADAAEQMRQQGHSTAALDRQIKDMNAQIAQLEANVAGMNSAMQIRRT